jgi:hypothetical protein
MSGDQTRCQYDTPHGRCSRRAASWVDWQQFPDSEIEDRRVCTQHLGVLTRDSAHIHRIIRAAHTQLVAHGHVIGDRRWAARFAIDGRYVEPQP